MWVLGSGFGFGSRLGFRVQVHVLGSKFRFWVQVPGSCSGFEVQDLASGSGLGFGFRVVF